MSSTDKRLVVTKPGENSRRVTLAESMWYYANGWEPINPTLTEELAHFLASHKVGDTVDFLSSDNKKLSSTVSTDHRLSGHLVTTNPTMGPSLGAMQIVRMPNIAKPKEQPKDDIEQTLEERGKTHGDFSEQAVLLQDMKQLCAKQLKKLSPEQRTAMELIMLKQVRILTGGNQCRDSWHDIAGYAKLGEKHCG